jgi:hypothetical protein
LVPLGAALLLAACKGATEVCTDPLQCTGVTGVTVTSPTVDTVMAVGDTTILQAAAVAGASSVTVPFTWASSNQAVATIANATQATGRLVGVSAGTVTLTASQTNNAVTGQLQMRMVNANLPAVTAAVTDTLTDALRQALSNTPRSSVNTGLTTCAGHVTSGHIRNLDTCLSNLMNVSAGGSAQDSTLLSVLDVFFLFSKDQLGL